MTVGDAAQPATKDPITIVPLDEVDALDLRDFLLTAQEKFWDERDLRAQHHPVWFRQFSHDGLIARQNGKTVGYLLGVVPRKRHCIRSLGGDARRCSRTRGRPKNYTRPL